MYAQADLNGGLVSPVLDSLSLLIGGRFTNNSVYGNNFSYEFNPSYRINKSTMAYLSYSTGFTTPSLYELYAPNKDGDFQSNSFTLGNSKLTAETSNSFEIGIKHRVSNNLYFTLAWFKTVVNNYIDYVNLWKKNIPIDSLGYGDNLGDTYLNVGLQTTQGFEMNVFMKLSSRFNVSGNVSLLSSDLKYSQSTVDTSQTHGSQVQIYDGGAFLNGGTNLSNTNGLLRRPGVLGNFMVSYKVVKGLSLMLRTRYVGSRYDAQYVPDLGPYGALGYVSIGDYTLVDAFASYDITKNIFAMVRVENIFNTQYSEILGYTTRGRGVYFNLRYTL
jgi:vitamin B12 transporter